MEWISTKDRPLYIINEKGWWECTEDGDKPFMAAIPYHNEEGPEKIHWWVHHCVIEDEVGLCVVGEDENIPAGFDMKDVEYYIPIPKPPKS